VCVEILAHRNPAQCETLRAARRAGFEIPQFLPVERQRELDERLRHLAMRRTAQQRQRLVALGDGFPTEARHAFEHGADAVGTIVGERLQGRRMIAEFLMLGAQAPIGPRLVAGSKIFDELAPIFDRFAAARWRCGHSFSSPSAPRRLLSAGSGAVA